MLASVYKSHNEAMENLWDERNGRHIFRLTISMKRFKIISRVIRFDNRSIRSHHRQTDKLSPIKELWDKWVESLPKLFNPNENVAVGEHLVGFRGRCPFKQYMPKKPSKYCIKLWMLCDSINTYVLGSRIVRGMDYLFERFG